LADRDWFVKERRLLAIGLLVIGLQRLAENYCAFQLAL
jgi:hypothetical protein